MSNLTELVEILLLHPVHLGEVVRVLSRSIIARWGCSSALQVVAARRYRKVRTRTQVVRSRVRLQRNRVGPHVLRGNLHLVLRKLSLFHAAHYVSQ